MNNAMLKAEQERMVALTVGELRALKGILASTDDHPEFKLSETHKSAQQKIEQALNPSLPA